MVFQELTGPIRLVFLAHALAGAVALLVFLIPLFSKKGGKLHVKTGEIYTGAMVLIAISALVITPWRALVDPGRTDHSILFAIFLFYISIFTVACLAYGLLPLRAKKRRAPSSSPAHLGPPVVTLLLGVFVQFLGWRHDNRLLMAFPLLGHITAIGQIAYWRRTPTLKMHWWYAHMNGMIVACIATITAFLVTALPRIFPDLPLNSPALWIAPGAILGTVANRWTAHYRRLFER